MASHATRSFRTESEPTSLRLVRQIQVLLKLLESLTAGLEEGASEDEPDLESKEFSVYGDDDYRYVSLKVPGDTSREIDINIHDERVFVRIER